MHTFPAMRIHAADPNPPWPCDWIIIQIYRGKEAPRAERGRPIFFSPPVQRRTRSLPTASVFGPALRCRTLLPHFVVRRSAPETRLPVARSPARHYRAYHSVILQTLKIR